LLWRQIASSPAAQCCCRDDTRAQPGKNIRKSTTPNSGCVTSCVGKALKGRFLLSFARRSIEGAKSCVRLAANVTVPGVRLRSTGAAAELRYSRVLANLRSGRDEHVNDATLLHTQGLHGYHPHVSGRSNAVSVLTRLLEHCSETTSKRFGLQACSELTNAFDDVSEHNYRRYCSDLEQFHQLWLRFHHSQGCLRS